MDLCQILREETFLRTIGGHIGQVIAVDNSDAYRAKLFGPRIRILVRDLDKLPRTVVLPRLDGEGVVEYDLEYSGMPNQCGRCRSRDHHARHCPKRESKYQRRKFPSRNKTVAQPVEAHPHNNKEAPTHSEEQQENTSNCTAVTETIIASPVPVEDKPTETQRPETPPPIQATQEIEKDMVPELTPNDTNFPHLNSPGTTQTTPQSPTSQQPGTPHAFVWRRNPELQPPDKGKLKTPGVDSTPITRQGYRSGRLADDFWEILRIPDTPNTPRKKLRVIPFICKNQNYAEYLVDKSKQSLNMITIVQIAELLAGVPWTTHRARQHIVNEVAQALHKILIFNNQHNTPLHKWEHSRWYSNWTSSSDGEQMCTLYANIAVPENKIKIRKGRTLGWSKIPGTIQEALAGTYTELIQDVATLGPHWQDMTGSRDPPNLAPTLATTTAGRNPFSVLADEETQSS